MTQQQLSGSFTAVIVDDETPAREELRFLIQQEPEWEVIGEASSGEDALGLLEGVHPNVVFLDIQLGDATGFEVAAGLLSRPQPPQPPLVIFATAYDEYAVRAFEVHAVDYLLKPFRDERVKAALNRAAALLTQTRATMQPASATLEERLQQLLAAMGTPAAAVLPAPPPIRLSGWKNGRLVVLKPSDLIFAYAQERNTLLKTQSEEFISQYSLSELEEKLDPGVFYRVHRGYLVNVDQVKEVLPLFHGEYQLVMRDLEGTEIPVGRTHLKGLRDRLNF